MNQEGITISTCLKAGKKKRAGELALWLGRLLIVIKDTGSIPSTHMEAHHLLGHQTHMCMVHSSRNIKKIKLNKSLKEIGEKKREKSYFVAKENDVPSRFQNSEMRLHGSTAMCICPNVRNYSCSSCVGPWQSLW